ncbi:MAG: pilus assembly protein MshP [Gammaproteobacteria bacterium]|nr:pilus assembly protein MshP [Gammaproteobacteria bacterium]
MTRLTRQAGFSLVTAIFLLVVVAVLVVYMTNLRVVQQTTLVYGVQGARALQAARSGIEWGIQRAIVGSNCAGSTTFSPTVPPLDTFSIEVRCQSSQHTEGPPAATITTYRLESIASSGSYGSLDYVQRRIVATVSDNPP